MIGGFVLNTEVKMSPKYCEEIRSYLTFARIAKTEMDIGYLDENHGNASPTFEPYVVDRTFNKYAAIFFK